MAERNFSVKKSERTALITLPIVLIIGALLAAAGSSGGITLGVIPVFALAVGMAIVIQWMAFIPAFLAQTEKYYDLTGMLSYVAITVMILVALPDIDARSLILATIVLIWTLRLGLFLFRRISRAGKDDRFDQIKPSFVRFLSTWTLQGLWVTFTAAAAWVAMTSDHRVPLDGFALVGVLLWMLGFGLEVVADQQKSRFNADPSKKGGFISSGLWSTSRHPNYFGEILLWIGVAIVAFPALEGWQLVALISPVLVILLLTQVSGVPLLEKKSDAKWGGQADYEAYKARTPVLVPRIW